MKVALYELDDDTHQPELISSQNICNKEDPVSTLQHYVDHANEEWRLHHAELHDGLDSRPPTPIRLVIHRIVHGGPIFYEPVILTPDVLDQLETLNSLAPLHNPPALRWIAAGQAAFPPPKEGETGGAQHVGVFDTGFFHDLPLVAQQYALPRDLVTKHQLRRYGFHGIAHEDMMNVMAKRSKHKETAGGKMITLQLGSGCSATALLNGHPQDTSMGFTPLEGLVMSTRSGCLDPALVTFLQAHEPHLAAPAAMEDLLYHQSGFAGLSGGESSDMKKLEQSTTPAAVLAIDVFMHRLTKQIGAYIAVLGGLDTLVFGGGIGEHAVDMRAHIVNGLSGFLPVQLDAAANAKAKKTMRISTDDSRVEVWVVAVDEAAVMVRDALKLTQPEGWKSQL